jgi:hypothetical protein
MPRAGDTARYAAGACVGREQGGGDLLVLSPRLCAGVTTVACGVAGHSSEGVRLATQWRPCYREPGDAEVELHVALAEFVRGVVGQQ